MKILIVAVNYNTYKALYDYLAKVIESLDYCSETIELKVIVADNSTKREYVDVNKYSRVGLEVRSLDNLGYLGAAQTIINSLVDVAIYDYVAISNVDLSLDKTFFKNLVSRVFSNKIGWIAPSIYSLQEGRDKKTLTRIPRWKFNIIMLIHKYPFLYRLYYKTAYRRKRFSLNNTEEQDIYAGHGAFILLTKYFFQRYKTINYPIFLFCEENYIAELIRLAGMRVRYVPSLKIWDSEHISVGSIDIERQCKLNYEALAYIKNHYY